MILQCFPKFQRRTDIHLSDAILSHVMMLIMMEGLSALSLAAPPAADLNLTTLSLAGPRTADLRMRARRRVVDLRRWRVVWVEGQTFEQWGVTCAPGNFRGTNALLNNCYRITKSPDHQLPARVRKRRAQRTCRAYYNGRLAEPRSSDDYLLIKQQIVNSRLSGDAWLGGTKTGVGDWKWDSDQSRIQRIDEGHGGDPLPSSAGALLLGSRGMRAAPHPNYRAPGLVCEMNSTLLPQIEDLQHKYLPSCPNAPQPKKIPVLCFAKSYGYNYTRTVQVFDIERHRGIRLVPNTGPKIKRALVPDPNNTLSGRWVGSEDTFYLTTHGAGSWVGTQQVACKALLTNEPERWRLSPFKQLQVYKPIHTSPRIIVTLGDSTEQIGLLRGQRVTSVKCISYIDIWTGLVTLRVRCRTRQRTYVEKTHRERMTLDNTCPYLLTVNAQVPPGKDIVNCTCHVKVVQCNEEESAKLPNTVSPANTAPANVAADMTACDNILRPASRRSTSRAAVTRPALGPAVWAVGFLCLWSM